MSIKQIVKDKALVSISRDLIDPNKIQGVILGFSKELMLICYIYDFNLDGLMILRRNDITDIVSSKTCKFQKSLLEKDGLFGKIDFKSKYKLGSWLDFIKDASKRHKYFIFEHEDQDNPEFIIGKIKRIYKKSIQVNYFTGTARWEDEPSSVKLEKLTSCQIGNNYLNVYERYFNENDT